MAMLDRYKKTGGFNQLLTLLETCGAQKRVKFLEIIRAEDPRWADALEAKSIDLNRFLSWGDSAVAEVTGAMLDINVAMVISSLDTTQQPRVLATLPHIKRKKVEDLLASQTPSPAEIATSVNRLFETIRKLAQEGILRMDKIDPIVFVDSDIEDRLKQGKSIVGVPSVAESLAKAAGTSVEEWSQEEPSVPQLNIVRSLDGRDSQTLEDPKETRANEQELALLRKRVVLLQQENSTLKQELAIANGKLDQIKKLA